MNTIHRTWKAACLFFLGMLLFASQARAAGTFKEEMASVAKEIQKTLAAEKQVTVAIGEFTGPPGMNTNFGPAIEKALGDELKALNLKVATKSPLWVSGNYYVSEAKDDREKLVVNLTYRIHAANGKVKAEFLAEIKNNIEMARMLGITAALSKNGDEEVRNEEIQKALDQPVVRVEDGKVFVPNSGEFAVEILAKSRPRKAAWTRPAKEVDGQAFVDLARNEMFEIRLHNRTKCESAVSIHIDGLDVFAFSDVKEPKTHAARYGHFIIPAEQSITIRGWHRTNDNADPFRAAGAGKVGVITLAFRASGESPDVRPGGMDKCCPRFEEFVALAADNSGYKEVLRHLGKVNEVMSIRFAR